jgi:hypothetical protein
VVRLLHLRQHRGDSLGELLSRGERTISLLKWLRPSPRGSPCDHSALVFGRIGDMVGRKYAFMLTRCSSWAARRRRSGSSPATALSGSAPVLLVSLRLLQGLALGGEYGGAAIAGPSTRGRQTGFTRRSSDDGDARLLRSLIVILAREHS